MFLYPILGPDSTEKSKNIWCAKDKAKAWQDWMVRDVAPTMLDLLGVPLAPDMTGRSLIEE